jgi:hypothetical protein
VDRIDRRVDAVAEQVPHRRGPDQGDEQIGTWPHAIAAEGVAERAQVMGNADARRRVEQAADAQRGVDHEAGRRPGGARRPQLKHVVDHHHRLAEVDQEVMHALADLTRGQGAIDRRKRTDDEAVEGLLQGEAGPVDRLERVIGSPAAPRGGVAGPGGQHQADGDDPWAHEGSWCGAPDAPGLNCRATSG